MASSSSRGSQQARRSSSKAFVDVSRQRPQLAVKVVAIGVEAKSRPRDRPGAVEGFRRRRGPRPRRAVRRACWRRPACRRDPAPRRLERELERHQRHGVVLDQPGLEAARGLHLLHCGGARGGAFSTTMVMICPDAALGAARRDGCAVPCDGRWRTQAASASSSCGSRKPVTARRLSSHLAAAARTSSAVTASMRDGQFCTASDGPARRQRRAIPAREHATGCPAHRRRRR